MQPRIGIVGAGPGGLSLARLLTDAGFADVTVLEKNARVGGKSLTVHHEGIGHEMGTCYAADEYQCAAWMREAGITQHPLKHHFIHDAGGELEDFKEFVEGEPGLRGMMKTGGQFAAYCLAWKRFYDWDLSGAPDAGLDDRGRPFRQQVARPFGEWLDERGLDAMRRFAMRTMTIMGYGPLDRVPTLYGLRWNVPRLFVSAVKRSVTEPVPGWQHLWEYLASHHDVRLGHVISGVDRLGGRYRVHTNHGALEFDHLVLSGALDEAAAWFPFTDAERLAWGVTGSVQWHKYTTTLVEADWFRDADTRSWEPHARDGAATDQGRILVARRTGDKSAVAKARSETRPSVYVCYQYGSADRTDEQQHARLLADLAEDGAKNARILTYTPWRYAPQLTPNAIREGGVALMERQQGIDHLWVTGATASHESVDNIVDYNERLVMRMEAAFKGGNPSDPELLDRIVAKFRWDWDHL